MWTEKAWESIHVQKTVMLNLTDSRFWAMNAYKDTSSQHNTLLNIKNTQKEKQSDSTGSIKVLFPHNLINICSQDFHF